jgi:hypothetical protein
MQRSNSGYTRAEGKRKADEGTDATTAKRLKDASATIASKLQSNTIRDLSEKVDVLLEVCRLLLRRDLARDNNLSQDANIRVKPLLKDIEPEPGSAIAKLTAGSWVNEARGNQIRGSARELIAGIELGRPDQFPLPTDLSTVEGVWNMVMHSIESAVGTINQEPDTLPSPSCATFLTTAMESIASGRVREEQLAAYLKTLGSLLQGPRAVQALMGSLYCRWIFQNPEPMYHEEYSFALTKTYETLAVVGRHETHFISFYS